MPVERIITFRITIQELAQAASRKCFGLQHVLSLDARLVLTTGAFRTRMDADSRFTILDSPMRHIALNYVLVVALLACPYLCMGAEAGLDCEMPFASCCACSHAPAPSDRDLPGSPVEYNSNCLCNGAVIDGDVRSAGTDVAVPSPIEWQLNDSTLLSCDACAASISFERSHQFPPSTGRDVCALTCALLL